MGNGRHQGWLRGVDAIGSTVVQWNIILGQVDYSCDNSRSIIQSLDSEIDAALLRPFLPDLICTLLHPQQLKY